MKFDYSLKLNWQREAWHAHHVNCISTVASKYIGIDIFKTKWITALSDSISILTTHKSILMNKLIES